MTPSDLARLIEKLEAASEGSRELDRLIADMMGTVKPAHEEVCFETRTVTNWPDIFPAYTTSLDAALSLVPEGYLWQVLGNPPHANALVQAPYKIATDELTKYPSNAPTPALALCIAALKARAALSK